MAGYLYNEVVYAVGDRVRWSEAAAAQFKMPRPNYGFAGVSRIINIEQYTDGDIKNGSAHRQRVRLDNGWGGSAALIEWAEG